MALLSLETRLERLQAALDQQALDLGRLPLYVITLSVTLSSLLPLEWTHLIAFTSPGVHADHHQPSHSDLTLTGVQ